MELADPAGSYIIKYSQNQNPVTKMAGRREYGGCSPMDGHQTSDYVVGKSSSKGQYT